MKKIEPIKKIDLAATFAALRVGDFIEINLRDLKESRVRNAATGFSKRNNVRLTVSVDSSTARVQRIS